MFVRVGGWKVATIIIVLTVIGCASFSRYGRMYKTAEQSYFAGDYDEAVRSLVGSLQLKPTYAKAQLLLKLAYPKAVDSHEMAIDRAKQGGSKFRWDEVVSEYRALIELNETMGKLPPLTDGKSELPITFELADYGSQLAEANRHAAEDHYQEGRRLTDHVRAAKEFVTADRYVRGYRDALDRAAEGYYQSGLRLSRKDDVEAQKQAAKDFKKATALVDGYRDASARYEMARKAGVKRIAVIPFEDKSGADGRYGAVGDAVVDGILSRVMSDQSATEFLEIISRGQLEQVLAEQEWGLSGFVTDESATEVGKILGVHEILTGQITRIIVTPERTTHKTVVESTQVCDRMQQYYDKKGKLREKCILDTVEATVSYYARTAGASISGSYKIIDVETARIKKSASVKGQYSFEHEWAAFSGDKRALSDEAKAYLERSERLAPVPADMVERASRDVVETLSSTLIQYAR